MNSYPNITASMTPVTTKYNTKANAKRRNLLANARCQSQMRPRSTTGLKFEWDKLIFRFEHSFINQWGFGVLGFWGFGFRV